ncbi:MAG: dihydrofolate reductase family protein [Pseudomonadota bacterium]
MRKLILHMQCSIDGFVASSDGDLSWIFPDFDEAYQQWTVAKLWQAGAHLMGRKTYGDMASYWPTSNEPYAAPMNQIPKLVFSKTLKQAPWAETQIVSGDLGAELARLKDQPGKDLLAHGGAQFAQSLVRTGLVDEYRLVVHPVALGAGLRLFPELSAPLRLQRVEAISLGAGLVAKVYRARALE